MQRDASQIPFSLGHERFVVELDPSQRFIKGWVEMTIYPLTSNLEKANINSRHCNIEKVHVNDLPAEFKLTDIADGLSLGKNTNIAQHQVYKSKYLNALKETDQGELSIQIPKSCIKQLKTQVKTTNIPSKNEIVPKSEPMFAPIVIKIEYSVRDPQNGVVFVQKDEEMTPHGFDHVYTVHQPFPGSTRSWLPCIDSVSDRCTWDMEFVVPRKETFLTEYENEGAFDEEGGMMVVCSGDMIEQVLHPQDSTKKIVRYNLSVPTSAPFIGFAIGSFEMIKLSPQQLQEEVLTATDLDENQQQSLMAEINMMCNIYAFGLPGFEEELNISCSFLMHAMHFYTQEYGAYPFSDFKLVFVQDAWSNIASSASLAICSSHLLHSTDVVDQVYQIRRELSQELARQWFGIYIGQKTWADTWLVRGIANYMGSLFVRRHLGNNEYRLRLKKDMELCCRLDINRLPVYHPALPCPLDSQDFQFMELKSPLIVYMLDKRMCKGGGTLGLSRVLPKVLVSAMSGELAQNAIGTHAFLRLCRKVSGYDTRTFAEQWIYRSGCPKFSFSFRFNRKKMVVEIFMRQDNMDQTSDYITPLFTGNLTVRIHEADGTPYEHVLDIQTEEQKFEVQFNTKYKRIRRNTKRFQAKQAAAAAAVAEEEQEHEENNDQTTVLGIIPSLGLGLPLFEDPIQKKEWRVIEWGQDEDASGASSAMFDWIRLDAELEWVCTVDFKQPDYMWAAQLTKDRDVVAQHEAIHRLKHMPSEATSTSLLRAIIDSKCFYKIRMEAIYGIASCGIASLNWIGLYQLSKMFCRDYCFPPKHHFSDHSPDGLPFVCSIPKPNNFSDLSAYFLQKASVVAFSQIRDDQGLVPIKIKQFLLDLLRYNDNVGNEFSDCYYVAALISALGDATIPSFENKSLESTEDSKINAIARAEIERFRTLDYVVPSYHNVITIACLKTITKFMLKRIIPVNLPMFVQYTRYGNYQEVRLAAFDSIYMICGLSHSILNKYLLNVMARDPSIYVSHYVARAMLAWLGLALKESEDTNNTGNVVEEFAEEEGKVAVKDLDFSEQKTPFQIAQQSIENVRKRFEANKELEHLIWSMLNSTKKGKIDHCVHKCLLQFCEFVYKPADMGLKVTIRVPPTPIDRNQEDTPEPSPCTQKLDIPSVRTKVPSDERKKKKPKHKSMHPKEETLSEPTQFSGGSDSNSITPTSSPIPVNESSNHTTFCEKPRPKPEPISTEKIPTNPKDNIPVAEQHSKGLNRQPSGSCTPLPLMPSIPVNLKTPEISHADTNKPKKLQSLSEELKKCRCVLNRLNKYNCALPFVQPVDEKLDGAPNYYTIINEPMDLSMIKSKVENREYRTFKQMEDDIFLMLNNCFTYNLPDGYVYREGLALQAAFKKEVSNLPNDEPTKNPKPTALKKSDTVPETPKNEMLKQPTASLSGNAAPGVHVTQPVHEQKNDTATNIHRLNEKNMKQTTDYEKMEKIVTHAMTSPHAFEFLRPVDPIRQGVPEYFTIIKKPMDLSTIQSKLRDDVYKSPFDMDKDMRLIFQNCYAFNPPDTYVYNEAKQLEELYKRDWKRYFGSYKTIDKHTSQPVGALPKVEPNYAMDSSNAKKCERIIKKLWAHQASAAFHKPVDAIASGVPNYYEIVKKPMDLTTLQSNFDKEEFQTIWELESEIRQIFWNCYGFNHHESWVVKQCEALESFFNQIWSTEFAEPDCLKGEDKRIAQKVMNKLTYHNCAALFNVPVDLVALPDYTKTIKKPMDLRTVWEALESGKYTSLKALDQDICLVFKNCFTYNAPGTFGYDQGKILEKHYQKVNKGLRSRINGTPSDTPTTTKRPNSFTEESEPSTKIRKKEAFPL
ncbi:hypothetical protein BY458DRAFT_502620 [Sporodiniella umbellata]|nr:hypothetical protein BY458DRAFT_502620 [Sporodiniella umbellata]